MNVHCLRLSDRVVDLLGAVVHVGADALPLTSIEVQALAWLGERANTLISREELEREVWGFRAGVRSEAVPVAIRRLRKKTEPDPANPVHLRTVKGEGWELVVEEVLGEEEANDGAPADLVAAPAWLDSFVGREAELTAARGAITTSRLVTVTGPGGVGKTRLASELAARLDAPVAFVALAEARSPDDVRQAVLTALGLAGSIAPLPELLDRPDGLVLVLDNTEQLPALGEQVHAWLLRAPSLRILATSRRPLGVPGEHLLPLHPLLQQADSPGSAEQLFLDRARAVDPWLELDAPDSREAVRRLVELLDGLPLALELAAARVRLLDPRELVERADQHLRLLRDSDREERHSSLDRALDWSWQLLEPWARAALGQLTVFEGRFEMADAEAVLDLGSWPEAPWPVDAVQHLVDHSLVSSSHQVRPRLSLLVGVRAFALAHAPPDEASRRRHARRLARWASLDSLRATELQPGQRALLLAATADLHAAASWALDAGEAELAAACAIGAAEARRVAGQPAIGLALARRVRAGTELPLELAARLDLATALLATKTGDRELARLTARRACEAETSPEVHLRAVLAEARVLHEAAEPAWRELAQQALDLARQQGDTLREADARNMLVDAARVVGDLAESERQGRLAVAAFRSLGFEEGEANALITLGNTLASRGELDAAAELMDRGLAKLRLVQRPVSLSVALLNLGIVAARRGQLDQGRALFEECRSLARRLADRHLEAGVLGNMGELLREQGQLTQAEDMLRQAVAMCEEGGWRAIGSAFRSALADVLAEADRLPAACEEILLGARGMGESGYRPEELRLLVRAVELHRRAGRGEAAEGLLAEARELALVLGEGAAPYRAEIEALTG